MFKLISVETAKKTVLRALNLWREANITYRRNFRVQVSFYKWQRACATIHFLQVLSDSTRFQQKVFPTSFDFSISH